MRIQSMGFNTAIYKRPVIKQTQPTAPHFGAKGRSNDELTPDEQAFLYEFFKARGAAGAPGPGSSMIPIDLLGRALSQYNQEHPEAGFDPPAFVRLHLAAAQDPRIELPPGVSIEEIADTWRSAEEIRNRQQ